MIGQPKEFPTKIGRSIPTASQYDINAFASPVGRVHAQA
jgi:hypothetical protein